jgi:hypothetical protein
MYQSFPVQDQARAPLIYRYFAELEWEQNRPGVALTILTALAEGVIGRRRLNVRIPSIGLLQE